MRVNYLLILACMLASVWAWQQQPALAERTLIFSSTNLTHGRAWTLLPALFVHASPVHLFGNMLFLFVFGNTLERHVGAIKHLAVFFCGGILAFLFSLPFMPPGTGMLGASAAIFTVAACVMLIAPLRFSFLFLLPQGLVAIIYFFYNVAIVYAPSRIPGYQHNVAYAAHIIGFLIGIAFGIALSREWKKNLLITLALFALYLFIISGLAWRLIEKLAGA
ncbi:MAG TPA: rhomboid family intramembrane serine protease [Candidatus Binatia bacterium]